MPKTALLMLVLAVVTVVAAALNQPDAEEVAVQWGAGFVVGGLAVAAWLFGEVATWSFVRSTGWFHATHWRLFRVRQLDLPLASVERARLDIESLASEGKGAYRIVIESSGALYPFLKAYGGKEADQRAIVDRINRFLASAS